MENYKPENEGWKHCDENKSVDNGVHYEKLVKSQRLSH